MKIYEACEAYYFKNKEDAIEMALSLWQETVYNTFICALLIGKFSKEKALESTIEREKSYSKDSICCYTVKEITVF